MAHNGLLLVNLGSPVSPTNKDVRAYLKEFLSDQNVVELPKWFWQPLLRGIILPSRTWRSATFYQHMWTKAGSPLIVYTQVLRDKVQKILPDWDVQMAMTYGQPDISETLHKMAAHDDEIVVLPLFPQYTQSTHDSIFQQVRASGVKTKMIKSFYQEPRYLKLLASGVDRCYPQKKYDAVLFSYHGIPTSMVKKGDPYRKECLATTAGATQYLKLPHEKVRTVFQSKFGPMPWLKPYLKNTLMELAEMGKRNVLIVTPSFVEDCLETIEENNVQNYQQFRATGGQVFDAVPPMNANDDFCQFVADLSMEQINPDRGKTDHDTKY